MDHSLLPADEEDLPSSHPARRKEFGGKNEKKRGWGEAMELAHQTERGGSSPLSSSVVAVDLSQFRNTEVGTGYQAKHVVRQRTASAPKTKIKTINRNFDTGLENPGKKDTTKGIDKETLLRNDGLRAFRKEIENILSS